MTGPAESPMVNRDAERAIVGTALVNPVKATELLDRVPDDRFHDTLCRVAWETIRGAVADGQPTDVIAVTARMVRERGAGFAENSTALFDLSRDAMPASVEYHVELVERCYMRRLAEETAVRIHQQATDPGVDPEDVIEYARQQIDGAMTPRRGGYNTQQLMDLVLAHAERPESASLMKSGWRLLDDTVTFRPGQMVVVGARPGIGKTSFATDYMRRIGLDGYSSVFFSLEMTAHEIGAKLAAAQGGVDYRAMMESRMSDQEWVRLSRALEDTTGLPFECFDDPNMTIAGMRSVLQRTRPKVAAVDYVQLIQGTKGDTRQEEVGANSRALAAMAKEFDCTMIVLSQLNRESAHRSDKKPTMTDLRESGQLEQDADVVMLLHRVAHDDPANPNSADCNVQVPKNRGGPTTEFTLGFQGAYSRFVQPTYRTPPEPAPQDLAAGGAWGEEL